MNSRLLAAPSAVIAVLALSSVALAQDPGSDPGADPAAPPVDAGLSGDATVGADATLGGDAAAPDEADAGGDAAAGDFDPSDGRAGDPLPVAQAQRPLVLPHLWLSPSLGVGLFHLSFGPFSETFVNMGVGATLGLGDIAEVEVSPFQSALSPSFEYGASLGGTVRFVDQEMLEVGGRLRTLFTTDGIAISPGVPVRLHASDMVRVDTGAYFGIITDNAFSGGGDTTFGLSTFNNSPVAIAPGIPLELTVSPIDEVWVGAGTGFGMFDFANAGDSIFVPLGLSAGGTVPVDGKPLADLGVGFGFPYFIGTLPGADTVITELWSLNFTARANLDLNDMMQQ